MWTPGDRLTHRHNPELGIGRVVSVDARAVVVEFPRTGTTLRLAGHSDALARLDLEPGRRVRVAGTESATVRAVRPDGQVELEGGGVVSVDEVWPLDLEAPLLERLGAGDVDPFEDFTTRLDALRLAQVRQAGGLGSFLGGRIRLFPHQLHTAERAAASDPVRWLLADEVGLGKTIEACLVLNRLVLSGRAERMVVVAPATLVVQWLGELWRKHHQVFVLLDEARLTDVVRDFGSAMNPFEVHRRVVVSLETLVERPRLSALAVEAGTDLLVVDEAHHLRRPPGHAGSPEYRAIAPIAALGRHVLLLTATPFEDDAHGFYRLLQLLRPEALPDDDFQGRVSRREPFPACTSSTRRVDIGGLPPRVGVAIDLENEEGLVLALRTETAPNALARRRKADRVRRALASGAALVAALSPAEEELRVRAAEADAKDPRLRWLAGVARRWREAGEKTLVFVEHKETLDWLRGELSRRAQLATGVFHEDLAPARRDIEVAQFRLAEGPSLLISTECGGEGRNFEFCHRLVLFDLPWSPMKVEQRIGRLDRIGRRLPVEIVFFRPLRGVGAEVARRFEELGLFRKPLAGLEPELARVEAALVSVALDEDGGPSMVRLDAVVAEALAAGRRVRDAADTERHRDRYRPEMAEKILARVPDELDSLNQDVVIGACERLGFHVEPQRGRRAFSIEFGAQALVESLPGVAGGSSFLGTFDREEAVAEETLDFFAAGHPLVEGVLAHLEESATGRVGVLRVAIGNDKGFGLAALYRQENGFEVVVKDKEGRDRPGWAAALRRRPLRSRRVPGELLQEPGWAATVRAAARGLDPRRPPLAVAALLVGP